GCFKWESGWNSKSLLTSALAPALQGCPAATMQAQPPPPRLRGSAVASAKAESLRYERPPPTSSQRLQGPRCREALVPALSAQALQILARVDEIGTQRERSLPLVDGSLRV